MSDIDSNSSSNSNSDDELDMRNGTEDLFDTEEIITDINEDNSVTSEINEDISEKRPSTDEENIEVSDLETSKQLQDEEIGEDQISKETLPEEKTVTEKHVRLPIARIKHIIKLDPDVNIISQDAVFVITKATELFLESLSREAYSFTTKGKKKTMQRKDVNAAIESIDALYFLDGSLD